MPKQVALICTTERIDGYADAKAGTELYAVNISTALVQPVDQTLTGVEDLLRPWTWTALGGGPFQFTVWLQTDPADITKGTPVVGTAVPPPALETDAALKSLTDSLTAQLEGAANQSATLIAFDNANPGNLTSIPGSPFQPWPHLLAHASTFPTPVPQALNLVIFFRVPTLAANVQRLYAAPRFMANGVTCDQTGTHPSAAPAPGSGAIAPVSVWTYPQTDVTLPAVTVYQPGFDVTTAPASAWIAGTPEDSGNQDWRTNLDQRLPDSFDLAQRSLDAIRGLTPAQITAIFYPTSNPPISVLTDPIILEDLRIALLSALRDTADFGLRYAPDGASLLQFVLRGAGLTDAQIAPIQAALTTAESGYTVAMWTGTLQLLFPGLLVLQPVITPWPANQVNLGSLAAQLDALQTKLADDATLAQCIFLGWDSTLGTLNAWTTMRKAVQTELTTLGASHTLRKRTLQANIGGPDSQIATWKAIIQIANGQGADTDQLQANLVKFLPAFFASRFNQQPAPAVTLDNSTRTPTIGATQPGFPGWQSLLTAMNAAVANQAVSFASDLFPAAATSTTVPQPLIFKVHPTDEVADQNDPLRSMSGVGILLREQKATEWSALNLASLYVNTLQTSDPITTPPNFVRAKANVLAPYRLSIRNGIRQTAISYDNQPLIAQSPLTPMSSEVVTAAAQGTAANPLFQFRYEPDPTKLQDNTQVDAWAHIYGLKFGRGYDFLPFRMTNSGALPRELTDGAPWNLLPPSAFKSDGLTLTSATYLRRVPIAHPRLPFIAADAQQGTLPAIPASVFPLARAFPKSGGPSPVVDAKGNDLPLLLLWETPQNPQNPSKSYTFTVRPPQINLQTWDRWVSAYPDILPAPAPPAPAPPAPASTMRNTRAAVHADTVASAKKSVNDAATVAAQTSTSFDPLDTSIDDPAISFLEFTLTVISTSATKVTVANLDQLIAIPGPQPIASTFTYLDGFAQVQSVPYTVTIAIDTAVDMKVDRVARTVTVTVLEGDIWRLTVTPLITADDFARFEKFTGAYNQFGSQAVTLVDPSGNNVSVYRTPAAARELIIEAAAKLADTTPKLLWSSLSLGFDQASRMLTASLNPAPLTRPDLFHQADITHQVWRWMGRPFPNGPFPDALGIAPDLNADTILPNALLWEAQAFAERSLTDSHTLSSNINYPLISRSTIDDQGNVTSTTQVPSAKSLTQYDLSNDPRAHYYLFSLTLHSRYEGLPDFYPAPAQKQNITSSNPLAAKSFTPWNRIFLHAVASATPPPKPKILLCIPLTEPLDPFDSASDARTSFLVIADEPWPQIGGLAEELNASIQLAPDPDVPLDSFDPGTPLPEIGPDPILFSSAYSGPANPTFLAPGSPIGTTFDDLSSAPLFANTCFHFPLPSSIDATGVVTPVPGDWHMAKLTFVRSLRPKLTTATPGIALESAPSDPMWVQFLPSSYHFRYQNVGGAPLPAPLNVTQLGFQPAAQGIQFFFKDAPVTILSGPAGVPAPPPLLEIWAMLMQQITDAAGKPGEAYRGLYSAAADGSFQPIAANGIGKQSAYTPTQNDIVYLLEVQQDTRNIGIDPTGGVPAALFAPTNLTTNPDSEVTHRIVRLSPRVSNP
jgi:hypothetical protein